MFDIAKRNEQGLLVYDSEVVRNFCTERENALDDDYMEKFRVLFDKRDRGEISQDECNRLYAKLDDEHTAACEKLYDEEFGDNSANTDAEDFFAPPIFANA